MVFIVVAVFGAIFCVIIDAAVAFGGATSGGVCAVAIVGSVATTSGISTAVVVVGVAAMTSGISAGVFVFAAATISGGDYIWSITAMGCSEQCSVTERLAQLWTICMQQSNGGAWVS
jgi:hypothetical protein